MIPLKVFPAFVLAVMVVYSEGGVTNDATGRMIIDDIKKLANGTKQMFDLTNMKISPFMHSILSRITGAGSHMTQLVHQKKRVSEPQRAKEAVDKSTPLEVKKKETVMYDSGNGGIKLFDIIMNPEENAEKISESPRLTDIAGALGLGALALGALIASPVVLGDTSRDSSSGGTKWLDSLKFWKKNEDDYEAKSKDNFYNPYYNLDETDSNYRHDRQRFDYYNDFSEPYDSRDDQEYRTGRKKSVYYSDRDFWKDHYYKDGFIFEKGPISDSESGAIRDNRERSYPLWSSDNGKLRHDKNRYQDSFAASNDKNTFEVKSTIAVKEVPKDGTKPVNQKENSDHKAYITMDEVNKIANESLNELLNHYKAFLAKIYRSDSMTPDRIAPKPYQISSNRGAKNYRGPISDNSLEWQPLAKPSELANSMDSLPNIHFLKNHRFPGERVRLDEPGNPFVFPWKDPFSSSFNEEDFDLPREFLKEDASRNKPSIFRYRPTQYSNKDKVSAKPPKDVPKYTEVGVAMKDQPNDYSRVAIRDQPNDYSRVAMRDQPNDYSRVAMKDQPNDYSRVAMKDQPNDYSRVAMKDQPNDYSRVAMKDQQNDYSRVAMRDRPNDYSRVATRDQPNDYRGSHIPKVKNRKMDQTKEFDSLSPRTKLVTGDEAAEETFVSLATNLEVDRSASWPSGSGSEDPSGYHKDYENIKPKDAISDFPYKYHGK